MAGKTDNIQFSEEEAEKTLKGTMLFFVSIVLILSLSLLFFYSTVRAKCMGITEGYIKAIEANYQSGSYHPQKDNIEEDFETGIYKVKVNITSPKDENGITIKVSVKDKFFSFTHYAQELKLIPIPEPEMPQ